MKRQFAVAYVLSLLSIIFLVQGCTYESDLPSEPGASRVQPDIQTKVSGVIPKYFVTGDQLGIFPVRYNQGTPGEVGNSNDPWNIAFNYDGIVWKAASGEEFYLEENPVDIYAYYPYDPELGVNAEKLDLTAYPFDLAGDQQEKEADFLWAKTERINAANHTAGLVFHHVMSRIEINLHYETAEENPEPVIHNTLTTALIDMSLGTSRAKEGGKEEIRPKLLSGEPGEVTFTYEAIIVPQTVTAGTPILSVNYGNETMFFALPEEIEFRPLHNYVFNLVVGTAKEKGFRVIQ